MIYQLRLHCTSGRYVSLTRDAVPTLRGAQRIVKRFALGRCERIEVVSSHRETYRRPLTPGRYRGANNTPPGTRRIIYFVHDSLLPSWSERTPSGRQRRFHSLAGAERRAGILNRAVT